MRLNVRIYKLDRTQTLTAVWKAAAAETVVVVPPAPPVVPPFWVAYPASWAAVKDAVANVNKTLG
jgi:hypothetical protein